MKYKKWWMPTVFMVISAFFLAVPYVIFLLFGEDNSMTNHIYYLIGMGIWFFIAVPVLSLIYPRKVLADGRERFLLTLYNSLMLILPLAILLLAGVNKDLLISLLLFFIWAEMWAILGLAGRSEKKADVWYVPVFLAVAVLVINMYLQYFFSEILMIAILSCVFCPIAIAVYARICVRGRKSKMFFTVYVSLSVFVAIFGYYVYSIINGSLTLGDSAWNMIRLIISALGTFCLYELAALLGAGIKIKLPKRKKKPKKEEKKPEEGENTEGTKE